MMHKVAIIRYIETYSDYHGDSEEIIRSISDWDEVDDADFDLLKKAFSYGQLRLIERVELTEELKEDTVKAYLKHLKKQQADRDKYAKEQEAKAEASKKKREEKKAQKEKEEYERLKSKFAE